MKNDRRRNARLEDARRTKQFVRFSHRFEDLPVRGYILDIGSKFFLTAVVNDRIWFDGFECFRSSDVRGVEPDPQTRFVESALRKRHERKPPKPRVSVASIEDLLLTVGRAFPLVTIQCEQVKPGVCWIGRILGIDRGGVSLLQITPDAVWEDEPTTHPIKEITTVSFGADYENALYLVGGEPRRGKR